MDKKLKRDIRGLKKLREIFAAVPPHSVHMAVVMKKTSCGAAGCLLGWSSAYADEHPWFQEARNKDFGLTDDEARSLFALDVMRAPELDKNPHAISKRQVISRLDAAIAGKPIKPYVVRARATQGD